MRDIVFQIQLSQFQIVSKIAFEAETVYSSIVFLTVDK